MRKRRAVGSQLGARRAALSSAGRGERCSGRGVGGGLGALPEKPSAAPRQGDRGEQEEGEAPTLDRGSHLAPAAEVAARDRLIAGAALAAQAAQVLAAFAACRPRPGERARRRGGRGRRSGPAARRRPRGAAGRACGPARSRPRRARARGRAAPRSGAAHSRRGGRGRQDRGSAAGARGPRRRSAAGRASLQRWPLSRLLSLGAREQGPGLLVSLAARRVRGLLLARPCGAAAAGRRDLAGVAARLGACAAWRRRFGAPRRRRRCGGPRCSADRRGRGRCRAASPSRSRGWPRRRAARRSRSTGAAIVRLPSCGRRRGAARDLAADAVGGEGRDRDGAAGAALGLADAEQADQLGALQEDRPGEGAGEQEAGRRARGPRRGRGSRSRAGRSRGRRRRSPWRGPRRAGSGPRS